MLGQERLISIAREMFDDDDDDDDDDEMLDCIRAIAL